MGRKIITKSMAICQRNERSGISALISFVESLESVD